MTKHEREELESLRRENAELKRELKEQVRVEDMQGLFADSYIDKLTIHCVCNDCHTRLSVHLCRLNGTRKRSNV